MNVKDALAADSARIGLKTQTELAEKLGVSQQAVSNWENSGHVPASRRGALLALFGEESLTVQLIKRQLMDRVAGMSPAEARNSIRAKDFSVEMASLRDETVAAQVQRTQERQQRRAELERWKSELPPEMRPYVDTAVQLRGRVTPAKLDYASPTLAVEVCVPCEGANGEGPWSLGRAYAVLVRLLLLRESDQALARNRRYLIVMQIFDDEMPVRILANFTGDCATLGVTCVNGRSPSEVAKLIAAFEPDVDESPFRPESEDWWK